MAATASTGGAAGAAGAVTETPPDTRGTSTPLSLGTFVAGIVALASAIGGTALVQIWYAVNGGPLTPQCLAEGLKAFDPTSVTDPGVKGAEGVCHIITGLKSPVTTVCLYIGLIVGLAAAVVGFTVARRMDTKRRREQCIAGAVLGLQAIAVAVFLLLFRGSETVFTFVRNFLNFVLLKPYIGAFFRGAKNTLILAFGGEVGGIIIGLTLALFLLSARKTVRAPARVYVNFFRGTPLIWQLSFFYFLILLGFGIHIDAFLAALLVFSLNTGAYASEVFRAGIQSIERGQMEAARGLGFSYLQSMRYAIVPQAVRRVIPPLLNEFVILIKDTALVIILGLLVTQLDLFSTAQNGYSETFNATFFVATAIGYLIITLPLIAAVNAVEKRLRSGLVGIAGAQG